METTDLLVGKSSSGKEVHIPLVSFTRHGLIAGATGTGKTVTLKVLAEQLSDNGIPVITTDIKGDLGGFGFSGEAAGPVAARVEKLELDWQPHSYPVSQWSLGSGRGHPVRTTPSDLGPLLLAQLLGLNENQTDILTLLFDLADSEGLLLLDVKDVQALLAWVIDNRETLESQLGSLPKVTLTTIQRKLAVEFRQNKDSDYSLLGEPALELFDMIRVGRGGKGIINLLDARQAIHDPSLYSSFLLWLLSELFEELPEVGDLPQPKAVIFFDEAHILFKSASPALLEKIVMVVRLIRSRGVGLFFATQNPQDIPDEVLAQLATRFQHGMRVTSPKQQKELKSALSSLPYSEDFDAYEATLSLGVGEALVAALDKNCRPVGLTQAFICPPCSMLGTPPESALQDLHKADSLFGKYDEEVDRESAAEVLDKKMAASVKSTKESAAPGAFGSIFSRAAEDVFRSFVRRFGYRLAQEVTRGLLGTLRRR